MAQATASPEQMLQIDQVYLLGARSEERLKEAGAWCIKEELVTQQYFDTADYSLSLHATWLSCRNGEWKLLVGSQNIADLEDDFIQSQGKASEMEVAADDEAQDLAHEAEDANKPLINPHRKHDHNTYDRESDGKNQSGGTDNAFINTAMPDAKEEEQGMPRVDSPVSNSDDDKATYKRGDDGRATERGNSEGNNARAEDHGDPRSRHGSRTSGHAPDSAYSYAEIKGEGDIVRHLRSVIGVDPPDGEGNIAGLEAFLRRANVLAFSSSQRSERRVWRVSDAYTVAVEEDELLGLKTARVSLTVPLSDITSGFERLDRLATELGCERWETT
ncbi:uncharacterized protein LOC116944950 [Petromyzon marinus]|uniref:uncharacterized protein LOC116944950 n=1 Tax=Petromyzon marinus TaxID=7757 RepID=UPI003F71DC46